VAWVRGLLERIEEPMAKLKVMHNSGLDTELGAAIQRAYLETKAAMAEYERSMVEDWCKSVAATSDEKLNQPLLQVGDAAAIAGQASLESQASCVLPPAVAAACYDCHVALFMPSFNATVLQHPSRQQDAGCCWLLRCSCRSPLLYLQAEESSDGCAPTLAVNFDPALVRLLRETKYFLLLKIEVPESATKIFEHADTFRCALRCYRCG
jgi:hypothetical protein